MAPIVNMDLHRWTIMRLKNNKNVEKKKKKMWNFFLSEKLFGAMVERLTTATYISSMKTSGESCKSQHISNVMSDDFI